MEKSYKFANIENNLVKIFQLIYENQNINKYIYYLNNNPLSSPTVPIDLLDQTGDGSGGNFILGFYDGSIPTKEKIRLFFNISNSNLNKYPLDTIKYSVEVVLPNRWSILHGRGEVRAIRIFDEISQMIDQQSIGMSEAEVINLRANRILGTNYYIFSVEIAVKGSTMKGLR